MPDSTAKFPALTLNSGETYLPEELLLHLFDVSLTGIILLEPVFQAGTNEITDFYFIKLSTAAQVMLQLPERPDKTLLQLYPHTQETGVFAFYRHTFLSGEAGRHNVNYQYDGLNNYFHLAAQRSGSLVLVSFTDTADQNRSTVEEALRESQIREKAAHAEADLQRKQLHNILMQAPAMVCIFEGPNHIFKFVNPPYQQLVGDRPILDKPIAEAMPELAGQPIFGLLDKVYQTGESFHAHEMLVQLDHDNSGSSYLDLNFYNFIYQATRNLAGEIDGILVFAYEVTPQVRARQQLELSRQQLQTLNEELESRVTERTQALQQAQAEAERQRKRLERLFMQAPAAICILAGSDLVYELVNPAYQQLFPDRELLGKSILEALPEIEHNIVYRTFRDVYEAGISHEEKGLLIPLLHPDGQMENRYFNFIQQPRYDKNSQIDGVVVFAFEVTEQVAARQASEASARQLRLITDALPVLVGYLDGEEKYQFANHAYELWFNIAPETLLGRPVREVVGEKAYQNVEGYIKRALAGERLDFEARMPYRENLIKYIRTSYVPDIRAGEVYGFFTMVNDITDQVEAHKLVEESEQQAKALADKLATMNEELRLTNQQLTRTNVDLDNFIYTASHDLKAPILNIEGLMEALLEDLPPSVLQSAQIQQTIELISDSVQRFKRTIDHLTEIIKLQKENSIEASSVNLAQVLEDVQLDLAPAIQASRAQIEIDITNCPIICFSEKNVRSILYNLLSNALKYRLPERPLYIKVNCSDTAEYMVLSVQDNGLGIDLSQEHKLFSMFTRMHDHVEGSGIGLYMVKKIIQNAGGKIEVESKVGEGSTFLIYFPKNT